jgi:hypothetical protein
MIHFMVNFGYYGSNEDIDKLLPPMFDLMDSGDDLPFPVDSEESAQPEVREVIANYRKKDRFVMNAQTLALVKAKYQ